MTDEIKVIIKEPGEPVGHEDVIRNELSAFQNAVGGFIEVVTIAEGSDKILMICNEEGKLLPDMEPNIYADIYGHTDLIFGTVVICGDRRDDFDDCPIDLKTWEMLLRKWGN